MEYLYLLILTAILNAVIDVSPNNPASESLMCIAIVLGYVVSAIGFLSYVPNLLLLIGIAI